MTGVIPNYVKDEKFDILCDAGMNRVRMGIQSGSARILDFCKRPTPPEKVMKAAETINRFTPYMIPPGYDIIADNPIETKEDVQATLRLVDSLPRPFTLNLFSLRLQPNTAMDRQCKELGVKPEDFATSYRSLAPTLANALLYLLTVVRPPRALFEWWIKKVEPFHVEQDLYPVLNRFLRLAYLTRRGLSFLRHMGFMYIPGRAGLVLQKLGVIRVWKQHLVRRYARKEPAVVPAAALEDQAL